MRNFIIFFTEKEGSTPLVRLLDNFDPISMLHQVDTVAWEPFDVNGCGPMPLKTLEACLNTVYSEGPIDNKKLNDLYTQTAINSLMPIHKNGELGQAGVVGFKMRFVNPHNPLQLKGAPTCNKLTKKLFQKTGASAFKTLMFDVLKKNNVVVFFAVRQDLLRWGLSKYHGDGTGKPGHLQFQLANGKLNEKDIGKFHVDCQRLEKHIKQCENVHNERRQLMTEMIDAGLNAYPLCYEDFLNDKPAYLARLFNCLELDISPEQVNEVIKSKEYFKKVHSDDLSAFVINHKEVMEKVGNRFYSWQTD
ncbi:MAG: hypothetical protein HRT35_18385 [Algicola sp.]|nr:hypothetical protein [Algicola sp.]